MSHDWNLFRRKPKTNAPGGGYAGEATANTKQEAERLAEQIVGQIDADLKRKPVDPGGKLPHRK